MNTDINTGRIEKFFARRRRETGSAKLSMHNYYSLRDYVGRQLDGGLKLGPDSQGMLVNEDFIVGLHEGLEAEVGEAGAVIMYQCGVDWGKLDMERFEQRFKAEYGVAMRQMNVNFVLEMWWWPLTASGWGAWSVDLGRIRQGYILVDLFNSAVARSLERIGKPVCHLYAGMLAGALGSLVGNDLNCIEVQCYAMGEDRCRFLVGSSKRVDAVEFWLNEGASAAEIVRKLEEH